MRKALKLIAGPVLEDSPALLPRALPLLLATLLVSPACGAKVAATAAKVARGLAHPLLSALQGLPLPREGGEGEEQPAPKSTKKGSKKDDAKAQQRAAVAAERRNTAADAAYNARVVAALGAAAAKNPQAAAALVQLLGGDVAGQQPGAGRAEPLVLMAAHAAVHADGAGSAAVASALLRQLQAPPAEGVVDALPQECFDESGVPTGTLLERFIGGQLSTPALRSTAVLAALRAVTWADLAPRGGKVCRDPGMVALPQRVCLGWAPRLRQPLTNPTPRSSPPTGCAAAAAHALLAALAARPHRPRGPHGRGGAGRGAAAVHPVCGAR